MQEVFEKPTTLHNYILLKVMKQEKKKIVRGSLKLLNPEIFPKTILHCPVDKPNPVGCEIRYVYWEKFTFNLYIYKKFRYKIWTKKISLL